jgi:hypothetical protein
LMAEHCNELDDLVRRQDLERRELHQQVDELRARCAGAEAATSRPTAEMREYFESEIASMKQDIIAQFADLSEHKGVDEKLEKEKLQRRFEDCEKDLASSKEEFALLASLFEKERLDHQKLREYHQRPEARAEAPENVDTIRLSTTPEIYEQAVVRTIAPSQEPAHEFTLEPAAITTADSPLGLVVERTADPTRSLPSAEIQILFAERAAQSVSVVGAPSLPATPVVEARTATGPSLISAGLTAPSTGSAAQSAVSPAPQMPPTASAVSSTCSPVGPPAVPSAVKPAVATALSSKSLSQADIRDAVASSTTQGAHPWQQCITTSMMQPTQGSSGPATLATTAASPHGAAAAVSGSAATAPHAAAAPAAVQLRMQGAVTTRAAYPSYYHPQIDRGGGTI